MKRFNFYFAVDLDIGDVLTSVGINVKVGDAIIAWAHDFGDLGGDPEGLDATPLSSLVHMEKAGIVNQERWNIDYYFNNSDYDALETLKDAGTTVAITVSFPEGTTFSNTGRVVGNYLSAGSVNSVADAHATIELSSATGWAKSTTPQP